MSRISIVLAAILAIALAGCGEKEGSLDELYVTDLTLPNGSKLVVETMRNQLDITRGLMFRDSLAPNRGMLFFYPKQEAHAHWMYQVKFPVDMIWMDRDRRIVEMVPDTPPCPSKAAHECPSFGGHVPSRFVLEANTGFIAKNQLQMGEKLDF
jgi:uncharacterized membrane protein (UPF0127 family)